MAQNIYRIRISSGFTILGFVSFFTLRNDKASYFLLILLNRGYWILARHSLSKHQGLVPKQAKHLYPDLTAVVWCLETLFDIFIVGAEDIFPELWQSFSFQYILSSTMKVLVLFTLVTFALAGIFPGLSPPVNPNGIFKKVQFLPLNPLTYAGKICLI